MKKLLFCLIAFVAFSVVVSCDDDDTWKKYEEWRKINKEWIAQQTILPGEDGKPYYTKIVPSWNSQAYVLIKYFNDTMRIFGLGCQTDMRTVELFDRAF